MTSHSTHANSPERAEYSLSLGQERIWRFGLREPDSSLYHIPLMAHLLGPLNPDALRSALFQVIARHDALCFRVRAGKALPIGDGSARQAILSVEDLTRRVPAFDAIAADMIRKEATRPFDLESAPPLRARLVRLDPELHWLLLTFHHIAVDAWSLAIIFRELGASYAARLSGVPAQLATPKLRYVDFAASQRERLANGALENQLAFWRDRLRGQVSVRPPSPEGSSPARFRAGVCRFELPADLVAQVEALGRQARATPHMTLLALFQAWLSHRTGAETVLVGTPVACRSSVETESVVGLFVNTVVLRADLAGNPPFRALLDQVRRECLAALSHQEVPFERVFAEVCPGADPDRNPGFQAWFVLRNQRTPWTEPELELPGVSVEFRDIDPETVRFDLKLDITARPGPYRARLEFNRDVTTEASAASMASELGAFMRIASQEPHLGIAELGQRASVRCSSAVPNS